MADPTETTLTLDGCAIRLRRGGSGAPILLLHGEDDGGEWSPLMARLAVGFDVVAPEHPGFGVSDMPSWLDNIHDLAYFHLDLLAALNLTGVHLVGVSLGGWVAAEMAVRDTSRLASLTLVGASGLFIPGLAQLDPFISSDEVRIRALYEDASLAEAALERARQPEREDLVLKNGLATARLAWQPRYHDPHLAKWLHRIDVPTLLAWGASDRLFPKDYADAYQRLIPGSRTAIFANAGHLPHIEREQEFVAELKRFIAQAEGAP